MRIKYVGIGMVLLITLITQSTHAESDFQTWQWLILHLPNGERFKSHIYADNRLADNSGRERITIVGPRLRYEVSEPIQLGAGYLFLDIHDLNRDIWQKEHRFENELNFRHKVGDRWKLHNRNRFESRLRESRHGWTFRTRSRYEIRYQMNAWRFKSIYANNEIFWDHEIHQLSENRLVPIGLQFDLGKRFDLTFFYMIQSIRQFKPSGWNENHIFGTHLNIRF